MHFFRQCYSYLDAQSISEILNYKHFFTIANGLAEKFKSVTRTATPIASSNEICDSQKLDFEPRPYQ